jgi:signal transduction histidine kinase
VFRSWGFRLQTALVLCLFLGSLSLVFAGAFRSLTLPQRESEERDRLREASRRMAEAAEWELDGLPVTGNPRRDVEELNERLRAITRRILADFTSVEGGFFLGGGVNRFVGYGFPRDQKPPPPPKKQLGDEPPPKEAEFILLQSRNSLSLAPGQFQFDVRTVGPSRVAILTEPVGTARPAPLATWTMVRVVNPETLEGDLRRSRVSTWLALAGILVAAVLALNLGRTLKHQRLEQERLREDLRRSEHLAALGKLLAGVAHEVRNPLAGIRSTVQLWERLPDTARTQGSLHAVVKAVDRLNDIVTRLLYFSRADRAQRQPVSVNEVLREALKLLEAQAAAQGVELELDLESELPNIVGSAGALREVFLNLATNALQAMPQGGRLQCSTRSAREKHTVEIRFSDTGSGVPPDARAHLFEPFFTTRPDGTGLGLALCREIVTQHGGQIELVGDGLGATFRVVLA